MKNIVNSLGLSLGAAVLVGTSLLGHRAEAGWTGSMNGVGFGWSSVNVTSSTLQSNAVTTPSMQGPSAAMTNTTGYFAGGPLPAGASAATVARIKGFSNYVWKAATLGSNGDKTDNPELEKRIVINPSECAYLEMESSAIIAPDNKSGTIQVNAKATAGTAIWLRGYEYTDPTPPQTVQDLETNVNSKLKWDLLMAGPFDMNATNCNAIGIPFTLETSITNLYFVTDGVAKSIPLQILTPANVVAYCGDAVVYPTVYFDACGDVTVTFNPPEGSSFPVGTTPVTVTGTDAYGNSTNATFTVTVVDNSAPIPPYLPDLTGETSVQVPTPVGIDICGITTNPVTGTTTDPTNYTTQGTFTVHWKFDDGNGNVVLSNQTVIVHDDIPPTPPVIPDATGQCSVTVTPPVATDNVAGNVTGTTSSPLTYNAQGTNYIVWTFTDENGNSSTATQRVIVKDTIPPTAPFLPNLTGEVSVQVPTPTGTDNCSGQVTGTTSDPKSYSTQGTFTVHWKFDDGNGNVVVSNQTVIVHDDIPPVPPVIPNATGQCSVTVTPPVAVDNVAGNVTGTTSSPLTYSTQGTNVIVWTFTDENGNSSTATQKVIVKDNIPPAVPVLPTVTGDCSGPVKLTAPTTTDNCAGIVTGTTTDPTTYSAQGTYTVHWKFSDGNGNSITANQTVIVAGLKFLGFYSPIGTVSNLCTTPVIINQGSVTPIKFDMMCGSSYVTSGQPPIVKIQLWVNCSEVSEPVSVNAVYQNNWHYNWDTTGWAKGVYKIIVILPDGSTQYVFVKLK